MSIYNNKKIFICGPSGVGKTTLAKELSKQTGIPFIESSASSVWPKFGFTSHQDALTKIAKNPNLGFDYQMAILDNRLEVLKDKESFISDRTPFDTMVYYMLQNSALCTPEQNTIYRQRCKDLSILSNQLIYIPFGDHVVLEDNGSRIPKPMFQHATTAIFTYILKQDYMGVLKDGGYNILVLDYWDWETRVKDAKHFIRAPRTMHTPWKL